MVMSHVRVVGATTSSLNPVVTNPDATPPAILTKIVQVCNPIWVSKFGDTLMVDAASSKVMESNPLSQLNLTVLAPQYSLGSELQTALIVSYGLNEIDSVSDTRTYLLVTDRPGFEKSLMSKLVFEQSQLWSTATEAKLSEAFPSIET